MLGRMLSSESTKSVRDGTDPYGWTRMRAGGGVGKALGAREAGMRKDAEGPRHSVLTKEGMKICLYM